MVRLTGYIAVLFLLSFERGFGQDDSNNIQSLTPAVLLKKGRLEVKTFNNIYSKRSNFDGGGNRIDAPVRSTFLASVNSVMYGKTDKLNYGMEFWIRSRRDGSRESSPFSILRFETSTESRTELAYLGPKLKFQPFSQWPNFSVQTTLLFPFALDLDGSDNPERIYVDDDRTLWVNQFFLDHRLNDRIRLFFEASTWISFDREGDFGRNKVELPFKGFLSYFASKRWTIYYSQEFWPRVNENFIDGFFIASGVGSKYQVLPGFLEIELLYSKFLWGKNSGAGSTYNVGIRLVRWAKEDSHS